MRRVLLLRRKLLLFAWTLCIVFNVTSVRRGWFGGKRGRRSFSFSFSLESSFLLQDQVRYSARSESSILDERRILDLRRYRGSAKL